MMMHGRKENNLIIIENGQISSYPLDNRNTWEIGRPSKDNAPDIQLHSTTVSRKHGKFQCIDGVWFYLDYNGKNGTVYNQRHLETGLHGRIKPILLNDGDTFVFGGGKEEVINCKTIWGMYTTSGLDEDWRIADSKGNERLQFISGDNITTMESPRKGLVVRSDNGLAIYMGDLTYMIGDMEVVGC